MTTTELFILTIVLKKKGFKLKAKTSIRYFNNTAVRARWDDETTSWWYVATDIIEALSVSSDGRRYWNTLKRRNPELSSFCRQLKITALDGKQYMTDCLNQQGVNEILMRLPGKARPHFSKWLNGMSDPIDEQSKKKAYELYENSILDTTEIGTIKGLQQIHAYLFEGLYDFAGKIRTQNISKGGFAFANCQFFAEIFSKIDGMPENSIDEIVEKYVETNIAHPFMEGNGRATRIWLDCILKERLGKCVDWQQINKKNYLDAMTKSPVNSDEIKALITNALTDKIDDREIYMNGIDYSYYYETLEE